MDNTILIKTGKLYSKEMSDASALQFSFIGGGGDVYTVQSLIGETFETLIPTDLLISKTSTEASKAFISIELKGSKLQVSMSANPDSKENWLDITIGKNWK